MKEKLRQLPEALHKVILYRALFIMVSLLLLAEILMITGEMQFALPCLIFALYMIANTILLIYNCIINQYLTLTGECVAVDCTKLRKRMKSITLKVDDKVLVIHVKRKMKEIEIGDEITAYLSEKTPVYHQDGEYSVYDFYAIEVKRKA